MDMELLSPAGTFDSLVAAVQNGADAVYLGAQALNARTGAGNFSADELLSAADYAHERGVKIYAAVNIIVRQDELPVLDDVAAQLARAGVDAAIVQDFGVAARLHECLPSLALHASTQMAVHGVSGVRQAMAMGMKRVVLAREMTFDEIAACSALSVETEVFVHGALCVSCSGQCLMSSLVGGRSGNRGRCAQPCRLPYRLEGAVKANGYLLSTKDLNLLADLGTLRDARVSSLKIEGRLKRPEYVAIVTRAYREALDVLKTWEEYEPDEEAQKELLQIFNRGGFTRGYAPGLVDRDLMYALRPNNAGVQVARIRQGRVALETAVEKGDLLALRGRDGADIPLKGVCGAAGEAVRASLPREAGEGAIVYRLSSEEQLRRARESMRGEHRRHFVSAHLRARVGQRLQLMAADGEYSVSAEGDVVERALGRPADAQKVLSQLMKTGGTPYELIDVSLDMDADAFLPAAALNDLRRKALAQLTSLRAAGHRGCGQTLKQIPIMPDEEPNAVCTQLSVQASSFPLLEKARQWGAERLIYAPEDITPEGLARISPNVQFALCLPMVAPEASLQALHDWAWAHKDDIKGVIAQNIGQLALRWPGDVQAGEGLNLANREALKAVRRMGCGDYTPSVELNCAQLRDMDAHGGRRELIVYGSLALMQLRHCPIRARLGGAHAACARCDALPAREQIDAHELVDRKGVRFPLRRIKTSSGCVVRVMNSVPLCMARHVDRLPKSAAWRIVLTDECEGDARSVVRLFRACLDGEDVKARPEWAALEAKRTTTGHYFRGAE